jgi:hypothetical protein
MTLQPIPSEFSIYEENFVFFFISVGMIYGSEVYPEACVEPNIRTCCGFNMDAGCTLVFLLYLLFLHDFFMHPPPPLQHSEPTGISKLPVWYDVFLIILKI